MDRRDFVKMLSTGLGASLTLGVLAAIFSGCRAEKDFTGILSKSERQALERLSEAITPRIDDTVARQELHQPPFGLYRGDIKFDDVGTSWS